MRSLLFVVSAITALSNAHSNLLRFKEYQFSFPLPSKNPLKRRLINAQDTFSCTDTVPLILQKLCVRFTPNNDFQYKYESEPDFAASSIPNNDVISTNDDSNWNEIRYGQSLNNGRDSHQYVKQCRYSSQRRECVHYDEPGNKVTFGVKIPTDTIPRDSIHFADILPANIYDNNPIRNPINMHQFVSSMQSNPFTPYTPFVPSFNNYNSAHQFEYGDALGYDRWAADAIKCILCDVMSNLNIDNIFKDYGDFTYLFNEHEFDYNMDKGWVWKVGEDTKCTAVIARIEHKICATESEDGKVLISFEKEDDNIRRLLDIDDDIQNEFDGVILDFDDDNVWDDVTQIEGDNSDIFIRKCRAFQLAHFCVTHGDDDYLRFHIKVGTHKLHRREAPQNALSKVSSMLNNLWSAADIAYDNDYNEYEYEEDLQDIVDEMENEYENEGNDAVADVLEEIADEIEEDIDAQIVDEYDEELEDVLDVIADEVVEEIEDGKDIEEVLEVIVDEIDNEGDLEDVLEKIVDGVDDGVQEEKKL